MALRRMQLTSWRTWCDHNSWQAHYATNIFTYHMVSLGFLELEWPGIANSCWNKWGFAVLKSNIWLQSEGRYPNDELMRDELMTMLFAGSDTASHTLAFLLHCLAANTAAQDRFANAFGFKLLWATKELPGNTHYHRQLVSSESMYPV